MLSLEQEVGAWDSVLLEPLTEDAFIGNLQQRFKRDNIYTYIGNVLISVNPYKTLALYSTDLIKAYVSKGPFQLPPHIYAVAGSAYRWMRDRNEDQVIIISGESGSGKTECARVALQFLSVVGAARSGHRDQLIYAGTLLEAFGNAKTLRNDNASRFSKFIDVEFDYKGETIGGHVTHYLLEKSRVTCLSAGDRNFHVFYQLLTGADIQLLKSLKLQRNVDKYSILKGGDIMPDDKAHFSFTKRAFEQLGFTPDEFLSVFKVVAAVLKLANLVFIPTNNIDGTEGCTISNDYELNDTCVLLGCDLTGLTQALTRRGGVELGALEVLRLRDCICRALYGRLFTWLVNKINEGIKVRNYNSRSVGIIDFSGFEILSHNSLEQLSINYCNERLQQCIIAATLSTEQAQYIREGLEWSKIEYFDNNLICDLIDKSNHGIFNLLEEPHVVNDDVFLSRLQQCWAGHSHCLVGDQILPQNCFQLRHYAGTVTYNAVGFVEKNSEVLSKTVCGVLYHASHPLLASLFPEGNPKRCPGKRPCAVGAQLRQSMETLTTLINSRHSHYVRCIKPNELKQPRIFEMALVQHQVRYMGLMALVHLWRSGYCFNMTYLAFLTRYRMLCTRTWPHWSGTPLEGVATLLRSLPLPAAEFSFGRTKLFVRSPRTVFELEDFRRSRLSQLAILIQKTWRCCRLRRKYLKMKRSQIIIASAWRSWRECRFGVSYKGRRHLWCLYRVAREEYRILKYKKQVDWAVAVIQRQYIQWKRRQFLIRLPLRLPADSASPLCREWPSSPRYMVETSRLLQTVHHHWRCHQYRMRFDQTSRNRMREKVTASIIFKERKASYSRSVSHPFLGDYVRLRQNVQWRKICIETNDQYVVFADIINKITRSSGKFVPILLVLSTSAMLLLDQRTLQIKYRVPAAEIYRLSLSPYLDDVAVFHVRADASTPSITSHAQPTGCLFQSDLGRKKGDFVFQTGHVIEIVTKLFLVVQNAVGKPPEVHISTEFEANFGPQTVIFTFKCSGLTEVQHSSIRVIRRANRMEVIV